MPGDMPELSGEVLMNVQNVHEMGVFRSWPAEVKHVRDSHPRTPEPHKNARISLILSSAKNARRCSSEIPTSRYSKCDRYRATHQYGGNGCSERRERSEALRPAKDEQVERSRVPRRAHRRDTRERRVKKVFRRSG